MTLGDKLSKLRKENNMTQEQLADTLGVSRQSISKWESDLALPETDKLIRISELFNCSLDYLLKNSIEEMPSSEKPLIEQKTVHMDEAIHFLTIKQKAAIPTGLATLLCILSPIVLFLLGALCETENSGVSENMAAGLGMIILLTMVAVAVIMFISTGKHSDRFEYLEKEQIRVTPDVAALVRDKKEAFRADYTKGNIIGAFLCIISLIPLFCGIMLFENDDFMEVVMLCLMFILIAVGVLQFIRVGIPWESYNKLLQEGDYSPEKKALNAFSQIVAPVYWLCATAIYLTYSFVTNNWGRSWIVWPIAGVLFPVILTVFSFITNRNKKTL